MRTALKTQTKLRGQISRVITVPAPTGGWNIRDALADMPETDAVILDNWMPKASYVELRGGYTSHVASDRTDILSETGSTIVTEDGSTLVTEDTPSIITGTVKTLMPYNTLTGQNKLFAVTETGVFDVTNEGVTGAALIARTNGKHQWTMFGDGTSNWLIAVNGVDDPLYYDGTTWTAVNEATSPALTGYTGNAVEELVTVNAFKGRLFFIPRQSLSFWYLPSAVAGGALSEFDISSQCTLGGYLVAMGTWTRDAGDGQDDVAVFVTSEGEAILYQGNNPSNANAWAKIGTFFIGKPLGRRCMTQYGGDLIILTENGAFPLSAALPSSSIDYRYALSSKIDRAFADSARQYGSAFGWEAIVYPSQQALVVNIPLAEDGLSYQYVMNTLTKSWCRFTGWNAATFAMFNNELYFADGNSVFKAWTGGKDGTDNIESYGKQAFHHFGQPNRLKIIKLYRPLIRVNGAISYLTDVDVDFEETTMSSQTIATTSGQAVWNVSQWNQSYWAGGFRTVRNWASVSEWPGFWISGKLKIVTNSRSVQWMASDYVFENGGTL